MSRLARSGADWYQLLELCALSGALLVDADGVYDPMEFNDRLLLGLKGTMSGATRGRTLRVNSPVGGSMSRV
jgi:DNA invertase Pin-like site-specific DNA recombinase